MLGLSAWKSGQLPLARESFERAITLDPKHVKSRLNLSRVLLEQNEPREAVTHIEVAITLDSTSGESYRLLGRARAALNESEEAIEAYQTALTINDRDVWAMNNLGLLLMKLERHEEALAPLARAIQLDSSVAVFRNNFGMALEHTGHFVAATESYRAAVTIDPGYTKAQSSLTRIDGRKDDPGATTIDVGLLADDFVSRLESWRVSRVAGTP
jgi:superkiller protein 3